jgi:predicted  nucleic acid-binding Zn-ribbon protein
MWFLQIINSLNLPSLKLLLEGVEKDAKRKKEEKAETRQRVKNIKQKLEEMQTNLEHIQDLKPELSSLREQLNAVRTDRRRLRRSGLEVPFKIDKLITIIVVIKLHL